MKTFKKEGADKYELYAITDRKCLVKRSLEEAVEEALDSGISILQLREKDISEKDYICEAMIMWTLPSTVELMVCIWDRQIWI